MRVITHYSLIALFVVLNTSLEGPNNGKKSAQVYPEHPRTSYVGAEADDWPTLRINLKTAAQEVKIQITSIILHNDLVSYYNIG